ncbi:MAG: hypothetical protein KatS3mg121_0044 [Gammaproteobacteria bacterium]|nr:MAG: hypothetical protein KatS3mg121_0044 [Gammaproteobacteria bacterium]
MSTWRKWLCGAVFTLALSALQAGDGVDINSADAATLAAALDGVGEVKAQAIVAYRQQHGPFTSIEQLLEVNGIGEAILEKNRERIRLGAE